MTVSSSDTSCVVSLSYSAPDASQESMNAGGKFRNEESSHELVWPGSGCGLNSSWVWPKPFMGATSLYILLFTIIVNN